MFSSFLSSIGGSYLQSPKSLLATYLASSLSEFFLVDKAKIQSNLLSDTKIVLHHVKLKEQETGGGLVCNGSVQEIEFSWKWGGGTTTQFVRDVVLTIRGAKFRLHSASEDPSNNGTAAQQQSATTNAATAADDDNKAGYLQQYVQQVVRTVRHDCVFSS